MVLEKNTKYHNIFMQTAELWAKQSYCKRAKIGAVIVKDNRIISTGFNGTITGTDNICEEYSLFETKEEFERFGIDEKIECESCNGKGEIYVKGTPYEETCKHCNGFGYFKKIDKTNVFTLHAEANAILWAAKEGTGLKGTSIFITCSPCPECAKLIAQAGIKEVYYKNDYKNSEGVNFLKSCNIYVKKLD